MDGYWVAHLKVEATITELDFDRKCHHVNWSDDSGWKFSTNRCNDDTLAIIPKENILFVEWRESEVEE